MSGYYFEVFLPPPPCTYHIWLYALMQVPDLHLAQFKININTSNIQINVYISATGMHVMASKLEEF